MFDINFHPNLEKGQFMPTTDEMTADTMVYLTAGMETTASAMTVITWALLNNPQMMQRLKAELRTVMPQRDDAVGWAGLEKLSYLVGTRSRDRLLRHGYEG